MVVTRHRARVCCEVEPKSSRSGSVERVIEVFEQLMAHSQGVANIFVELFLRDDWRPFESAGSPQEEWPRVRRALEQLRPLASEVLLGAFHRTMAKTVEEAFGQRLDKGTDEAFD
jgi:hypothetical protein